MSLYFSSQRPYPVAMRAIAAAVLLVAVGCSSAESSTPDAVAGAAGQPSAAEAGAAGQAERAEAGSAGAAEAGAGGAMAELAAGAAGVLEAAGSAGDSSGDAGSGGAAGPDPGPVGELFAECAPAVGVPSICQTETCGAWAPVEGGQMAYLCTFSCVMLQGQNVVPDPSKVSECKSLGGQCLSPGGFPVCVPHGPE